MVHATDDSINDTVNNLIINNINPFTAKFPAERCRDEPANSIFSGPVTSTFNVRRCDESPFTCQREKEDKKAQRFPMSHFYWSFSNNIVAVKGLNT